jgi:hypothetical protein
MSKLLHVAAALVLVLLCTCWPKLPCLLAVLNLHAWCCVGEAVQRFCIDIKCHTFLPWPYVNCATMYYVTIALTLKLCEGMQWLRYRTASVLV